MSGRSYVFVLGDGTVWGFQAVPKIRPWLDSLARLAEFAPCNDAIPGHRLEFVRLNDPTECQASRALLSDGFTYVSVGGALRIWTKAGSQKTVIELNTDLLDHTEIRVINMWSSLWPIQAHALHWGGGPFHALLAEYRGMGVLIAGAPGSGKSTCYRRLPSPWQPLCDDQALVVKCENSDYAAHPFPTWSEYLWQKSDKTWRTGYSIPLRAVFFLEQADRDRVESVAPELAAPKLFEAQKQIWQKYWRRINSRERREQMSLAFDNACAIARALPAFALKTTLHGSFWEEIEEVLGQ